ncbi:MAG TPA: carboxylesterase [Gammaproteobacteria bacterium]|jgi:phospholipase/carboxylesterase|nr:carboxylesterase [Gammaproteobacteria bacterium]
MPATPLDTVVQYSGESPQHTIIWLHGLGADGHDFAPIVPELQLPASLPIKFVFPHAPVRPITLNAGMSMRGWYDLKSLELDRSNQDPEGVQTSSNQIQQLIAAELEQGIPAENIILAGFSQGGAIALHSGLTGPVKLAGIMGLSTYLPLPPEKFSSLQANYTDIPIFLGHGEFDDVVHIKYAEMSRDALTQAGFAPEWHTYRVAHGVTPEEIRDLSAWIQRVFQA